MTGSFLYYISGLIIAGLLFLLWSIAWYARRWLTPISTDLKNFGILYFWSACLPSHFSKDALLSGVILFVISCVICFFFLWYLLALDALSFRSTGAIDYQSLSDFLSLNPIRPPIENSNGLSPASGSPCVKLSSLEDLEFRSKQTLEYEPTGYGSQVQSDNGRHATIPSSTRLW